MPKEYAAILIFAALYLPILWMVIRIEMTEYHPPTVPKAETFTCSFCMKPLHIIHDFGTVALAGGFLKPEQFAEEKKYPLRLCYCESCYALQLADRVPPDVMFKDYFYFSSANETIRSHFRQYAADIVETYHPKKAIEIGCNDGVLINPLRELGVKVTGVDPSSTVPKGPGIINDYFTPEVARKIGKVDMVIANNVFAHITDIHSVTRAILAALKDDGVFVMEAHYLVDMLSGLQYDWIYHEHVFYYSLLSLENHFSEYGLTVFDVKHVATHGGSMRYFIGKRPETAAVTALREEELRIGLDKLETYQQFSARIARHGKDLRAAIGNAPIAGYGASGRANALIQYCGLNVSYIVDDAPAKHGFYTPGSHIPIYSRDKLKEDKPDRLIAFAWGYMDEISRKCDVPMLAPFPVIRTIEKKAAA